MTASTVPARSRWILSAFWDSVLFIGAPAVCIATLIPLRGLWPSAGYSAFLLAFFTFGHHLPGFLRAYGDRELFLQYRWRFLLAPPVVFAAALWFAGTDLHGLLFLVFTWDIWHVLMQHYGFMRIYDAKSGQITPTTARLDRAISVAWYLTLIALSPHYTHNLLLRAYSSGVPPAPARLIEIARTAMLAAAAIVSAVYVGYHIRLWMRGQPLNLRKLALLACFVAATWYLYVKIDDFQVGFAVWSAFHCLQYYGIVWAFNGNRAIRSPAAGAFLRFLFRPRATLVVLYAGLIIAYGAINYLVQGLPAGAAQQILMAFIVTSGTLHYYYDGFIWKVREPETRRSLGIAEGREAAPPARMRWSRGVIQAGYLATALIALGLLEARRPNDEWTIRRSLALAAPEVVEAQITLGDALRRRGQLEEAAGAYAQALRPGPAMAQARNKLAMTLAAMGRRREAIAQLEQVLALDPSLKAAHYNLASLLVREGNTGPAIEHYRQAFPEGDEQALHALEADPDAAEVLNNLGLGLLQSGAREAGIRVLRRAVAANPRHAPAQLNLASALVLQGRRSEAQEHYQYAIRDGDAKIRASAERALQMIQ